MRPALLACLLAVATLVGLPSPASAVPGSHILGHRCRLYDAAVTNENTIAALQDTAGIPGAACEIDVWTLRDGSVIVWHDSTWGRVANHSTLPPGVEPRDRVKEATWSQVSAIRTKGGQPVPSFRAMIDAAARNGVPLVVDIKNTISSSFVSYARSAGASVSYYQLPQGDYCSTGQLGKMRAAGAQIGLKLPTSAAHRCWLTPSEIAARGASFVTADKDECTAEFVRALDQRGIDAFARGAGYHSAGPLLDRGVDRLLVNQPRQARNWPG